MAILVILGAGMAAAASVGAMIQPPRKAHYKGESPRHLQLSFQSIGGSGGLVFGGHGGYYFFDDFMAGADIGFLYQFDRARDDFLVLEPLAKYLFVNRHFLALSVKAKAGRYINMGQGDGGWSVGAGPGLEAYFGRRGFVGISVLYKRIYFPSGSVPAWEVSAGVGF